MDRKINSLVSKIHPLGCKKRNNLSKRDNSRCKLHIRLSKKDN